MKAPVGGEALGLGARARAGAPVVSADPDPSIDAATARSTESSRSGPFLGSRASKLFTELQSQYRSSGEPVTVSFREMVGPIPVDDLGHSVYPYPARLLRQIPRFFLAVEQLTESCELVLDPFCGSGTTLVEARAAGVDSWGIDANPFARLLSTLKTTYLDPQVSSEACNSILARAKRSRSGMAPDVVNIDHWYGKSARSSLSRLYQAILETTVPLEVRNYLLICLALTADRCSLRDPRIPVPVRRRDWMATAEAQSTTTVWRTFESVGDSVSAALSRVPPSAANAYVLGTDAASASEVFHGHIGNLHRAAGLVITSPPYGAAQKYVRSCSLALGWTGLAKSSDLAELEHATIGREHVFLHELAEIGGPTAAISADLRQIATVDRRRAAIYARYFVEMDRAFESVSAILADGGHLVLIAGSNVVTGRVIDTHLHLRDLAARYGLVQTLILQDEIRGRVLLTNRANLSTPLHSETVFVLRKAGRR